MEHLIRISPAYDRRDESPNYGQHSLEFHFVVRDSRGALVFTVVTGWYIEALQRSRIGVSGNFAHPDFNRLSGAPYCQLFFHVPATLQNSVDQDPHENCGWLDGDSCQVSEPFGSTGKPIGDLFMTLVTEGLDRLWKEMEWIFERQVK